MRMQVQLNVIVLDAAQSAIFYFFCRTLQFVFIKVSGPLFAKGPVLHPVVECMHAAMLHRSISRSCT